MLTGVVSSPESFWLPGYLQMTFTIAFGAVLRRVDVLHRPGVTFRDCDCGAPNMSRCRSAVPRTAISDVQNLKFFNVHCTGEGRNLINNQEDMHHLNTNHFE